LEETDVDASFAGHAYYKSHTLEGKGYL